VVDIDARLTVEIRVENYEQIVKNDRGHFLGTMTKVPGVNSLIRGKVDETIEQEVKQNLEQTLPDKLTDELTKGLRAQGVNASVDVSLAF
jgi:hypothetical protein